jgi:hypothetical protein
LSPAVAVVGSADVQRDYAPPMRSLDAVVSAAREIGRELADKGWSLVVYSSQEPYVERDVVDGYLASGKAATGSIEVRGKSGEDVDFPGMAEHPGRVRLRPEPSNDWTVGYYRSLLSADGVLLIGGGRSTFVAGILALSRGVAVAPLAAFGGAAQQVWERIDLERDHATSEEVAALAGPWHDGSAAAVVASLTAQHERAQKAADAHLVGEARVRRRTVTGLLTSLVLLLAGLGSIPAVYTVRAGSVLGLTVLVLAPFLTSISGAIIRNTLAGAGAWLRAAALGAGAGTMAFLLFVAAQIATNPDMLTADESARRLVVFVLAVGFAGGFTSEAIYARLREENLAPTSPLHPPGG